MNQGDIKKQIEMWRERRAEKLMSRLSRQTSMSTATTRPSPSVLGIKVIPSTVQSTGKQVVVTKKPQKKERIEVRQTKSSSLRIQLANPLWDVHSLECSRNQSLLTTGPGDVTSDRKHEKSCTFSVPQQKSAIIERSKIPASELLVNRDKSRLSESFRTPNLNHRKNLHKMTYSTSNINNVGMIANQTKPANNKQTDKVRHVDSGKVNVNSSTEVPVYKSNKRRETFSIGSSVNETLRKTELQLFEDNYCNKTDFIEVSELFSDDSLITQTEHSNNLNETVQNIENISVEHKETHKRRETFNIDLNYTNHYNTEPINPCFTETVPEFFSDGQKKTQSDSKNVDRPHVLRSLCTTNVKSSQSYRNFDVKRSSKSLSNVNKLTGSNTENRKHDSSQRKITTSISSSLTKTPVKVMPLQRALTYSHITRDKFLPSNRRQSFIIGRKHDIFFKKMVSPISEEGSMIEESMYMSTPKPKPICNSVVNLSSVKSTPHCDTLMKNLKQWLIKRNKPVSGYRHLQCFLDSKKAVPVRTPLSNKKEMNCTNIQMPVEANYSNITEDKENMESSPNEKKLSDSDNAEIVQQTRGALTDLRRLILEGYDHDECERWIQALRTHSRSITDLVEYWECVAALEETRGDIKMAVDSYQRAIIRGAEVEPVNEHLNRLFDKMVLLDINPSSTKPKKQKRTYVDPRNIFSSTVIRFALQQKAVKKLANELEVDKNQLHYLATPVRRTTRVQNKTNPNCVRSLSELTPEVKNNTNFKPNPAFS